VGPSSLRTGTAVADFDIFLSHNSRDKSAVERIATKLKQARLEPWLDKWCLTPGGKWQEELATGLRASSTCGFFIGPNGVGDWASEELQVALDGSGANFIKCMFCRANDFPEFRLPRP
jgi:hypothetical protein